ncbi:MAG: hypothetical protein ACRCWW_08665 [Scandinavium sp.]|uniref:hypothetical protein n=1 Tax=Scandinavium sp. TaxID=2830653 RepID=UPI003F2A1A9F
MTSRYLSDDYNVEYTIEQIRTVPPEAWNMFISSVANIYHRLPFCFRPVNPRCGNKRTGVFGLFAPGGSGSSSDELVFRGLPDEGCAARIITITRENRCDTLDADIIVSEHQMSVDLFTRQVLLALHNVCGEYFQVHSTASACSWGLPLALLNMHTPDFCGWVAPDKVRYSQAFTHRHAWLVEQLMTHSLTLSLGIDLSQDRWEAIAEAEFQLYRAC